MRDLNPLRVPVWSVLRPGPTRNSLPWETTGQRARARLFERVAARVFLCVCVCVCVCVALVTTHTFVRDFPVDAPADWRIEVIPKGLRVWGGGARFR